MAEHHNYDDCGMYAVVTAVCFQDADGKVYYAVYRELKSNPRVCKEIGMLGFVSETKDPDDRDPLDTAHRGVEEEVGIQRVAFGDIFVREESLKKFQHGVPVYASWALLEEKSVPDENGDEDVTFHSWMTEGQIRSSIASGDPWRIETISVLDVVTRGRGGVDA